MSDFFHTHTGNAPPLIRNRIWKRWIRDALLDVELWVHGRRARIRAHDTQPRVRVLVVGIEVPTRATDIRAVTSALTATSRHDVTTSITPMADRGKFANIDVAIEQAPLPLTTYDWLVIVDDDIAFAPHFLDDAIALASSTDLVVCQPAHAFRSHTTYALTRRRRGSLVRQTSFVEIGPLTLIHRRGFDALIPFPPSRWCYGIDVLWAEIAQKNGYRLGILDGTPIRHLRPVAGSYDMTEAIEEGRALLKRFGVTLDRDALFSMDRVLVPSF